MRQTLVKKLCCPFDKTDLDLKIFVKDTEENILEGILTCAYCKRYFPIAYGVPIMTPDEYREPQLEAPLLERWDNKVNGSYGEGFRLLMQQKDK